MSQSLCRCCHVNTNVLVYLLVILFGVASWVDINGLWVELPILVQHLPEGWDLPSYMAVIIQVANVAPLLYTISSSIWPQRRIEVPVIYVIISVGAVSCLLLAFFWDKTSSIAGTEHSTALLVLQFFLALVDCTSSVAFLPFMSIFKPQYMIAYFIGEGFSGLIPSLVSLGQGAGSMECLKAVSSNKTTITNSTTDSLYYALNHTVTLNASQIGLNTSTNGTAISNSITSTLIPSYPVYKPPRFTVKIFFIILMCLMILSLVSFTLLNFWSYCKKEYVRNVYIERESPSWQDGELDMTTASTPMTKYENENDDSVNESTNGDITKLYPLHDVTGQHRPKIFNPKRGVDGCNKKSTSQMAGVSLSSKVSLSDSSSSGSTGDDPKRELKKMSKAKYALFLILTAWINALVCGVLPSIQTYSCLPYGIQPYHLSVTLASISNPVACFAALFLKITSAKMTLLMTFLGSALSGYVLLTAATSPSPPLVEHPSGAFLVILSWVVVVFFLTYTKVCIAMVFRKEGRRAMLWVGAFTQVGALVGAVTIFFIINYYKLFQWANPCM